jgi:DNA-binding GntR family transcriptional regulator
MTSGGLDEWSTVPLYRQLADLLRTAITGGTYGPGDRLPSEPALQQEHGLARDTVRAAIAVLRDEGLVVTLPGRGTFVKP